MFFVTYNLMIKTHVGFYTILNIWNSGHDIIQGWDICNDGFLIWMRHIHICKERRENKALYIWWSTESVKFSCVFSHPQGPVVWWHPVLSLQHWMPAPGSPGCSDDTLDPCQSNLVCGCNKINKNKHMFFNLTYSWLLLPEEVPRFFDAARRCKNRSPHYTSFLNSFNYIFQDPCKSPLSDIGLKNTYIVQGFHSDPPGLQWVQVNIFLKIV